ncbi:hypothetical protein ROA7023_03976 [Roseisalinus antarcticus]|uniref:Uncharacterized protein n=1 Tax=Roseisalinus antarcticus TaxID=254357 RepID=A0A1Y5TWK8_9RHOB|nr:hypothetical protein ROA7023_03976 [Roseisalinus antarcticus]
MRSRICLSICEAGGRVWIRGNKGVRSAMMPWPSGDSRNPMNLAAKSVFRAPSGTKAVRDITRL